jgi:hypothetical protein
MSMVFENTLWSAYIKFQHKDWRSDFIMQNVACFFMCSLAIMEGVRTGENVLPSDLNLFNGTAAFLETCSNRAPCKSEFAVMLACIRAAEVAAACPDLASVLKTYDIAIDGAAAKELRFLEAMSCESAAQYIFQHTSGSGRAACGYLIQSYQVILCSGESSHCVNRGLTGLLNLGCTGEMFTDATKVPFP